MAGFGSGFNSDNMKVARQMLKYCRFSYKLYAQSCAFPLDPFYESHGEGGDSARTRLCKKIHKELGSPKEAPLWRAITPLVGSSTGVDKFDPVEYLLDKTPNPHKGVVYRGGAKDEPYILFQPLALDKSISYARGFDINGTAVDGGAPITTAKGNLRCAYFQGKTGLTQTHPTVGWTSWLGAVIYDSTKKRCVIVFRGSRSGVGGRALKGALLKSAGSPDWVTDMNWLKGVNVRKYDGANMGAGFHYAYESCKDSLKAAFLDATKGSIPSQVYFTGHSLGGGLATVAYIDFVAGDLYKQLATKLSANVDVSCFPISAPPVILGREAHRKMGMNVDATKIYHYFNPKDCVHASSLIEFSGLKLLNGITGAFSHPLTDPYHLGTEICLTSRASFPDAHEVFEVWKGMNGGTLDNEFWTKVNLTFDAQKGPFFSGVPSSLQYEFKEALKESTSGKQSSGRVQDWLDVVKSSKRAVEVLEDVKTFNEAVETLQAAEKTKSHRAKEMMKEKVIALRSRLLKQCFKDAKSHSASSSCYWVMVQLLTVDQIILSIK